MRSPRLPAIAIVAASLLLGGCFFGIVEDRRDEYLEARSIPPLELPPDLSGARIEPLLVIPELPADVALATDLDPSDPRPKSLLALEEQYAKIQRLGDRTWLVIAETPAGVWPLMKQFLADNGVRIEAEDAVAGTLRTSWVLGEVDATDIVRQKLAAAGEGAGAGQRSRLFYRVEAGIRPGTTEVYVRQIDDRTEVTGWPQASVWPAVEGELLNELGSYLASDVGGPAVSYLAQRIGTEGKSQLRRDAGGRPELLLRLDFDRAWATVGQALSRAEVNVVDLDRTAGVFFLEVNEDDVDPDGGGLLSGWFGDVTLDVRLEMHETSGGYALAATDATGPQIAERLLLLIQEHSG